ncbi:MAG: bifunctional pyr operon transcriptional regulator/uracil phosphoribosyltransferase PyrR [Gammaproteobacteria bacterium]
MNQPLPAVDPLIDRIAEATARVLAKQGRADPVMVGIRTGGVWIATRLHTILGLRTPLGTLNINFYRDDFTRIGMHPRVTPSNVPFEVQDRHIVLIDDVLHTGRTVRAALNEIFDYGRPASVTLGVLVERSGRELPIQPDVVGQRLDLTADQHVKLMGPADLELVIQRLA